MKVHQKDRGKAGGKQCGVRGDWARRVEVSYPPRPTPTPSFRHTALHFRRHCCRCVSLHCQWSLSCFLPCSCSFLFIFLLALTFYLLSLIFLSLFFFLCCFKNACCCENSFYLLTFFAMFCYNIVGFCLLIHY